MGAFSKKNAYRFTSFSIFSFCSFLLLDPSVLHSLNEKVRKWRSLRSLPMRRDWLGEYSPSFCKQLKARPQPYDPTCTHVKDNIACNSSKPQFFSQDGEDYYLFTRHIGKMKRPGLYVDVAANDAIHISNTYFFDRCLGWRGICAEANGKYFEGLHRERSCQLVPTCISDRDGRIVRFGMRGASGGILGTYKGNVDTLSRGPVKSMTCTDLKTVLKRAGVTHVDYLSLDVEGHELMVLRGLDWERVSVDIITVELSARNRQDVISFLAQRGFRSVSLRSENVNGLGTFHMNDPVFVHNTVVFGNPS